MRKFFPKGNYLYIIIYRNVNMKHEGRSKRMVRKVQIRNGVVATIRGST